MMDTLTLKLSKHKINRALHNIRVALFSTMTKDGRKYPYSDYATKTSNGFYAIETSGGF